MTDDKKENRIKLYGIIIGLVSLALQHGIYLLGNELAGVVGVPPMLPKIACIDDAIKVVPIFIIPYVWSYIFWGMTPMVMSKCKLERFLDFMAAYTFACLFGALILTFAPTYMNRVEEGLMDTSKTGFLYWLMRFWYSLDGGDMAYNLFPSFHCINTTVCCMASIGRKEIPKWYRIYAVILAVIIYMSTLFVKQHFVLDVISGVLIGVVFSVFSYKWHWGRIFNKPIAYFGKIFSQKTPEKETVTK